MYLDILSSTFGWIYVIAWSFTFWPQIMMNYRRQSVRGLSFDLWWYNLTSFVAYFLYCFITYFEDLNHKRSRRVTPSDMGFVSVSLLAIIIIIVQMTYYGSEGQRISSFAYTVIVILWAICLYNVFISFLGYLPWWDSSEYSTIAYLGYVKDLISFIKYVPQAWINFRDKTTQGWNIDCIMFDLMGGTFSVGQQVVDSINQNDWSVMFGNIPKLALSAESIIFDFLFLAQHYVLYGPEGERPILLDNGGRRELIMNLEPPSNERNVLLKFGRVTKDEGKCQDERR